MRARWEPKRPAYLSRSQVPSVMRRKGVHDREPRCLSDPFPGRGGIKGILSAALLAKVEEERGVNVADHFDLITGTPTGGIIALGLGLGLRPRKIVQFYVIEGPSRRASPC